MQYDCYTYNDLLMGTTRKVAIAFAQWLVDTSYSTSGGWLFKYESPETDPKDANEMYNLFLTSKHYAEI